MSNKQYYLSAFFLGTILFYIFSTKLGSSKFRDDLRFNQLNLPSPQNDWFEGGKESFSQNLAQTKPFFEGNSVYKCFSCDGNLRDVYLELENGGRFNFYIQKSGEFYLYNTGNYYEEERFLILWSDMLISKEAFYRSKEFTFCGSFFDVSDRVIRNWDAGNISEGVFEVWKIRGKNTLVDVKKKLDYFSWRQ